MASDHEDEDDDLYGTADTKQAQNKDVKDEQDGSSGDEPMDEGADSGDDSDDDDDSESVSCTSPWLSVAELSKL
jgi:pre-mRNA 3'-end-processing factor FIP1